MDALNQFFSWQFIMFCLGIAALNFVLRKVTEYALNAALNKPNLKKFWTEVFLPVSPVLTGSLIALAAKQYPFPEGIASASSRLCFGAVAGLLSGLVYRVARSMLKDKINAANGEASADVTDAP